MTSYVTPKKGVQFIVYVNLTSQSNTKTFQSNPTLASGDVTVSIDGGTAANLATLPTVTPSGGKRIKVTLSASEMNGDNIHIQFSDVAGAEWCDLGIDIQTSARQIDDLAIPGDAMDLIAGAVDAAAIATGAIDADALAADAGTEIAAAVWASGTRTLSAAGIQAIWDALTSALTTAGSIGKLLVDNVDAAISDIAASVSASFTSASGGTPSTVALTRGDTWAQGLTVNAFTWAAGDKLLLTIKESAGPRGYKNSSSDATDSILQWLLSYTPGPTDGLTYVNQAAASDRTKGSLAVVSASGGSITVNLDETVSLLIRDNTYMFDVVHISSAGARTSLTAVGSQWTVNPTVTRTVA